MSNLGAIGTGSTKHYLIVLDTWGARSGPRAFCCARTVGDVYGKPLYQDQWKRIAGTVKNASGSGIARRVIVIDNRNGALRGAGTSAVDGSFSIPIGETTEAVIVIAIPNAGDARNVVAFDAVVPV